MLKLVKRMQDLNFSDILNVYEESILVSGARDYPHCTDWEQKHYSEEDLYWYFRSAFFEDPAAVCALWYAGLRCVAALRLEPYKDGYLISGLETAPSARNKGYATELINSVLTQQDIVKNLPLYAHVAKSNIASVKVHEKCGFRIISDFATFIDGTVSNSAYTLTFP